MKITWRFHMPSRIQNVIASFQICDVSIWSPPSFWGLIKSDFQTFRMRALWTMMRLPDENSPLITLVLQDGWNGYGKLNLVVLIIMPILQYGWNGLEVWTCLHWLSCQLSWNHFIGKMEWSKWTKWKMVHGIDLLLSKSTWNFRVQAKA